MDSSKEEESKTYQLSWFINPHLFWLRSPIITAEFYRLELKLNQVYRHLSKIQHKKYNPPINEMVAYYNQINHSWHRAVVDYACLDGAFIIWLIDYGYPTYAPCELLRELTQEFREWKLKDRVLKVGVSHVLAGTDYYDFLNECAKMEKAEHWSSFAVKHIKECLEDTECIKLKKNFCIDGHFFGEVKFQNIKGEFENVADILLETKHAMPIKEDLEFVNQLEWILTTKIDRYEDNDRHNIRPVLCKQYQSTKAIFIKTTKQNKPKLPQRDVQVIEGFDDVPKIDIPKDIPVEMYHTNKVARWLEKEVMPIMRVTEPNITLDETNMPILVNRESVVTQMPAVLRRFPSQNPSRAEKDEKSDVTVLKKDSKMKNPSKMDDPIANFLKRMQQKKSGKVVEQKVEEIGAKSVVMDILPCDYAQIKGQEERRKRQQFLEALTVKKHIKPRRPQV